MSDNWKAGDLAFCINDCWSPPDRSPNEVGPIYAALAPRKGTQWVVLQVQPTYREEDRAWVQYLLLDGQPTNAMFNPEYFRKVAPPPPQQVERRESKTIDA